MNNLAYCLACVNIDEAHPEKQELELRVAWRSNVLEIFGSF
jgi:hypothetical protein